MKHLEQKIKIIKNQSIIADLALGFEPEIEGHTNGIYLIDIANPAFIM
ncbi:hypothetical protein [Coxiella burnetii]|nr:hypothetical protein [Coxiella burnetii]